MKNIDKAKILIKLQDFCAKNSINIVACGCCNGYHIEQNNQDLCCGCDFINDVQSSIDYKQNQGKIEIVIHENNFPKITMIKICAGKLVNLGGRSYPYNKFMKHMNNENFKEYFDYFI